MLPLLCGYLGYILWGFSYKFITVAQETASSTVLLSHRFVISCIIMLVLVATRLVNYATAKLPVVKISSLGAVTTVVGVLLGLLTGDPWNYTFLIGSVMIVVGIWQVTKVPKVKEESTRK